MREREDSLHLPDWLVVAKKDWHRMDVMLASGDAEAAGYFLQQSLEKYIKVFLLERGWKLRKIRELDALLDEAVRRCPALESFRELCENVSGYYLAHRYPPLLNTGLTCGDIESDLEEARQFISALIVES